MQQLKFIILQQFNQHKNIQDLLCTVLSVCQLTPVLRVTMAKKISLFQMADFSLWSKTVVQTDVQQTFSMAFRPASLLSERKINACRPSPSLLPAAGYLNQLS